jgi:tetratricopeptide (TPR) repeat protein
MKIFQTLIILLFIVSCSSFESSKPGETKQDEVIYNFQQMVLSAKNSREQKSAQYYYINALTSQQQGNWSHSVIDLQSAIAIDSSAVFLYSLSKSYEKLSRFGLSIEALNASIEKDPNFIPSLETIARIYSQSGKEYLSLQVLKRIAKIEPSKNNLTILAGKQELDFPLEAISTYEKLFEKTDDIAYLHKLKQLNRRVGNHGNLLKNVEKIYSIDKSDKQNALNLLDLYVDYKDSSKIYSLLTDVKINLDSEEQEVFFGTIGYRVLYDSSSFFDGWESDYLNLIGDDFLDNWRIQLQNAYIIAKQKKWRKADEKFRKVFSGDEINAEIIIQSGIMFFRENESEIAMNIFADYQNKFSGDARFPYFIGLALFELDKTEESISNFHKTLDLDSSFVEAIIQLGVSYDKIGQHDSSDFYYEWALNNQPDNVMVNNNYAYSLSVRNVHLEKALVLSRVAIIGQPENSAYLDTYGWILYKMGKYDDALVYIKKSLATGEVSAEVLEHLGDIYRELKMLAKAREAWQNALANEPGRETILKRLKENK